MNFVFPVLLGGLALIGIPVLIHLVMRQKPITLPFPAFRFLVQRRRTNLRKLRLRHLLLLLLRALLVGLVCFALARPRLFYEGLVLSGERPVAAVLVFDTSPSMDYRSSDDVARLDEARKKGLELLDQLPDGSRIVVLDTAERVLPSRAEWLRTRAQAGERVEALKVKPVSVPVSQRLETALRYLAEAAKDAEDESVTKMPRLVFLFTDRTRASWDVGRTGLLRELGSQVPPSLEGLQEARRNLAGLRDMLGELRTVLPPPPGQDYADQALGDALDKLEPFLSTITRQDLPPDEALGKVLDAVQRRAYELADSLRSLKNVPEAAQEYRDKLMGSLNGFLQNLRGWQGFLIDVAAAEPLDLAILDLALPTQADGRPMQTFAEGKTFLLRASVAATGKDFTNLLTLEVAGKTYQQPLNIPAGQRQTLPFTVDLAELQLGPGEHSVTASLESKDQLLFNNRRFVTFAIREPRRVLVLADAPEQADDLTYAIEGAGFSATVKTPAAFLQDPKLAGFQAVYLFGVADPQEALWKALDTYVREGGSLGVTPPGQEMNLAAYNKGLAAELLPGRFDKVANHDKAPVAWDFGNATVFQHPLLRPFREWWQDRGIDFVLYPRLASLFWQVSPAKEGQVLVPYADKNRSPALLERRLGGDKGRAGKVLLFTTTLDPRRPAWNNYLEKLTSFYPVLVHLTTAYLAGDEETQQFNFTSGRDEPHVDVPLAQRFPAYVLQGPEQFFEQLALPESGGRVVSNTAVAPGNYTLAGVPGSGKASQYSARFSMNVPLEESDLTPVPSEAVEAVLGAGTIVTADRETNIRALLHGHWSEPLELLPWLLLALLIILALENLLANKFYRREPAPAEPK